MMTGENVTEVAPSDGDGGLLVIGPVFGGAHGSGGAAVATLSVGVQPVGPTRQRQPRRWVRLITIT